MWLVVYNDDSGETSDVFDEDEETAAREAYELSSGIAIVHGTMETKYRKGVEHGGTSSQITSPSIL